MKRVVLILVLLFFTFALVVDPEQYMASVTRGLNLFASAVLPSLLPFFFFSKLLTSLDIASIFSKISKKPMHFLYRAPPCSGYVLVLAMLSGYPVGAKLIAELYADNLISGKEAQNISAFTLTSGPLFMIGTVGVIFLHNQAAGVLLLAAHYLAVLLNGLLYRGKHTETPKVRAPVLVNYDKLLSDAITNTVISLLIVGGYIAIFSMILDVLTSCGLLSGFVLLLNKTGLDKTVCEGIAGGIIEMTRGAETIAQSGASLRVTLPALGGIIAFGGSSIALQSITFLKKAEVSVLRYLCIKLTHALLAVVVTYLLTLIFYPLG